MAQKKRYGERNKWKLVQKTVIDQMLHLTVVLSPTPIVWSRSEGKKNDNHGEYRFQSERRCIKINYRGTKDMVTVWW